MSVFASLLSSAGYLLGLLLLFIGERAIGAGAGRAIVSGTGALFLLAAIAHRVLRWARADGDRRAVERSLLALELIGLLGVVLYALQSDAGTWLFRRPLDQLAPKLAGCLAALWPVSIVAAVLPLVLTELAHAGMARAPQLERGRIQDALYSGLGLAAVLVFGFCAVYVASARDPKWDLSYFRATRPGESTQKLARGLSEPLEVALFFPPANEVHDQVRDYFELLARVAPQVKLREADYALEPKRAKELGVTGNGAVVLSRGKRHEQLWLGTDLDHARGDLSRLDQQVQKRLLSLTRGHQVFYLTTGHGERTDERMSETDQRARLSQLFELLRQQDIEVRRLGAAEGLSSNVPVDAAGVLVLGPTRDFSAAESEALQRYLLAGGHVLFAFDPDARVDADALLRPLGVRFVPVPTANDRIYVQKDFQISDRLNLATASFSSHPSVTTLSQLGSRAPVVMVGAGHLETREDVKSALVDFTVFSQPDSWNDLDGDLAFGGKGELRKAWPLAAAVSVRGPGAKEEGRAVVLADSDALADGLLQLPGNASLALDGVRWLTHQEWSAGQVNTETDPPIAHTRGQDVAWFYTTIFLAPALVLAAGFAVTRRKRRAR
jgi:hypothetical protein